MPGERNCPGNSGSCCKYSYSESGDSEALLAQRGAPMEAVPATEDFIVVTKSDLEDLDVCGRYKRVA